MGNSTTVYIRYPSISYRSISRCIWRTDTQSYETMRAIGHRDATRLDRRENKNEARESANFYADSACLCPVYTYEKIYKNDRVSLRPFPLSCLELTTLLNRSSRFYFLYYGTYIIYYFKGTYTMKYVSFIVYVFVCARVFFSFFIYFLFSFFFFLYEHVCCPAMVKNTVDSHSFDFHLILHVIVTYS